MDFDQEIIPVLLEDSVAYFEAVVLDGDENVSLGEVSFEEVRHSIEQLAKITLEAVKKAAPQTAEIEFGLKLAAKSGQVAALIVDGSGEATIKIKLGWRSNERASEDDDA